METQPNQRGYEEHSVTGRHMNLDDLREANPGHRYLFNDVPAYPRPEFHAVWLKHDTGPAGLSGIIKDNGFKNPRNMKGEDLEYKILWWGLAVGPDEITAAEERLLETTYPDRTEEQIQEQEHFLAKFATSAAFISSSRLGSFRFTFPVKEVLDAYKEQFCDGAEPVMRVMKTVLYKQEVMYAVLVHSPADTKQFAHFPLLTDNPDPICFYNRGDGGDGYFLWRSEAMCCDHKFERVLDKKKKQMHACDTKKHVYYVWDNVALALHVNGKVLEFEREQLKKNLKFCEKGKPISIPKGATEEDYFVEFGEAQEIVRKKFRDPQYKLKRADEKEKEEKALTSRMSKLKVSQW